MVTQFVLRNDKKDAAGCCPVHLVVYFDGARLKCATGEKCKPADWNADRQQFRRSYQLAEEANLMLKRLAADALGWWRALRAAGDAPTLASLRAVLRPAPVAAAVAVVAPSAAELYLEYQASIRARGYAAHTLRARKMFGSWMASYEAASGERLTPSTYDLAAHDRVLSFLRFDRNLALNTVAAYVRGFKTFLRWCRDERGLACGVVSWESKG